MVMKKRTYIYLVLFSFLYLKAQAQAPHFVLVANTVSTQIKAKANDSLSLFYKFVYIGDTANPTFTGVVYTHFTTSKNDTPGTALDSFNTETQVPPVTIHSITDTFNMYCHIPVKSSYFNNGKENLIIIWPTGGRQSNKALVISSDTFQYATTVAISGLSGIGENADPFGALNIYPNPANTFLNIQNSNPALVLKLARIMDYTGREVMNIQDPYTKIDVSALKQGTYFLELNSADGDRTVYTFIISR